MPWKLILFLICLVATTFFIGFNLENSCNIHVGFKTYENVPVYLTVLISFVFGAVIAFLFSLGMKFPKNQKAVQNVKPVKKQTKKSSAEKLTGDKEHVTDTVIENKKKIADFSSILHFKKKTDSKKEKSGDDKTIIQENPKGK